ncbi:hypothetical protein [Rhodococcus xishaensis]|uniref:Holliday junction resolvase n=1 Tax=Rhodococcus xishaensis TaxID=2487364 RepID=A0A3S3E171_9NOCA|nr:hypothetical protein [Rhodococcus xishaensis]RVW03022.1 hypothetical protein EGT50_09950 [Rhodococcus xishaensis]
MANANKRKGDQEEREVLAVLRANGFPHAERTRPGRMEDQGDIFVTRTTGLAPGVVVQVKNVQQPRWREWVAQLANQRAHSGALIAFLTHKVRGSGGRPPIRLAVMELSAFTDLLRAAGHGDPVDTDNHR